MLEDSHTGVGGAKISVNTNLGYGCLYIGLAMLFMSAQHEQMQELQEHTNHLMLPLCSMSTPTDLIYLFFSYIFLSSAEKLGLHSICECLSLNWSVSCLLNSH